MLLLASVLIPPLDKVSIRSLNVTSVKLERDNVHMQNCMDQSPCEVEHRECGDPRFTGKFNCTRHAVELRTGIEFPIVLDNIQAPETKSSWPSEVLVGTGCRMMKVIKIKSQEVYAFGFYVHPYDVCKKLGPKYASIRAGELDKHHNFYRDLLREDISMTVRLVISVSRMKISTVRSSKQKLESYHLCRAFEKSLRARLVKTNPAIDFDCLRKFSSLFSQDAPIYAVIGHAVKKRPFREGYSPKKIIEEEDSNSFISNYKRMDSFYS